MLTKHTEVKHECKLSRTLSFLGFRLFRHGGSIPLVLPKVSIFPFGCLLTTIWVSALWFSIIVVVGCKGVIGPHFPLLESRLPGRSFFSIHCYSVTFAAVISEKYSFFSPCEECVNHRTDRILRNFLHQSQSQARQRCSSRPRDGSAQEFNTKPRRLPRKGSRWDACYPILICKRVHF